MSELNRVILYCRSGFENECIAEISNRAEQLEIYGFAKSSNNSAFVEFQCYVASDAVRLIREIAVKSLIFARQMFASSDLIILETVENRIEPILAEMSTQIPQCGTLEVEMPDSNEGKSLGLFCRKFKVPFRQALRKAKRLKTVESNQDPRCHLFFIDHQHCVIGYSLARNHNPFFMGIPRLKFPNDAPSRSALKLEEAFHVFIPDEEWDDRLRGGLKAVDLGACPGGWTYQLVKRSMFVYAIDNGKMAQTLLDSGQVRHYKEDGFKFEPDRNNIYWLVCDMVEKPSKISKLIAKWVINGWCRETIFNLKLPMKKRYIEVSSILESMSEEFKEHNINVQIQAKQLYHDREEVTVHIQRIWG